MWLLTVCTDDLGAVCPAAACGSPEQKAVAICFARADCKNAYR